MSAYSPLGPLGPTLPMVRRSPSACEQVRRGAWLGVGLIGVGLAWWALVQLLEYAL